MNFVVIESDILCENERVVLRGKRAQEIATEHELHEGKTVGIVLLGFQSGSAKVLRLSNEEIIFEINTLKPPPKKIVEVAIVGVSRPQTIKKVIQSAVTMGVKELHFVKSELGEKSYLQSKALLEDEIKDEIEKAVEQCGDPIPPEVSIHSTFERFFGETIIELSKRYPEGQRIVAHTRSGEVLGRTCLVKQTQPVFIAVGCELGWSEGEIKKLMSLGFKEISLGERILRVETAFIALVAQVQLVRSKYIILSNR